MTPPSADPSIASTLPSALPTGPSIPKPSTSQLPSNPNAQDPTNAEAIQSALAKLGGLTRRTSLTGSRGGGFTPISNGGSKASSKPGSGATSRSGSQANSTVTSPNLGPVIKGGVNELSLSPPGLNGNLAAVMESGEGGGPGSTPDAAGPGRTGSNSLSRISSHSSTSNISFGPIDAPSDILERSRPTTPAVIQPQTSSSAGTAMNPWANINIIRATPQGTPTTEGTRLGRNVRLSERDDGVAVPNATPAPERAEPSSAGTSIGQTPRARSSSLLQRTPVTSFNREPLPVPSTLEDADAVGQDAVTAVNHPTPRTLANLLAQPNNLQGSRTTTSGSPEQGLSGPLGTNTTPAATASMLSRGVTNAFEAMDNGENAVDLVEDEGEADGGRTLEEARARSAPSTPHFGAQTDMLRTLDESTRVIRQSQNRDSTRAPSVSGIGNLVEKPDYSEAKIVVAMVGLPARGKSYLSNKLMRYLRWLEYEVEVFNVGQLRRSKARDQVQAGKGQVDHSADYFSSSNAEANESREQLANESLESLISWLKQTGNVGIHDATNSTISRREKIQARVSKEPGLQLIFLESLCDDPATIATNIALKVSSGDPDYKNMSKADAERDFRRRIEQYEKVYETIAEPTLSYCKILNVGRQVTINRVTSYLQSRIAFYLMNLHLKPRSVYLSRHGESMHNVGGMIGGDSPLSPRGERYASALPALVLDNIGDAPLTVWSSTLQRTVSTSRFLPYPKKTWKSLDELDAGVCDGMTYEEIAERYPEDYESRDEDKFNYRYRGGESYRDVVVRLEPVIMELERQENILIICHQAVIRCLYAYFMALPQEELPYIKVPLHTLIKLTPMAYGCHEERYPLPIAAVDTHRPKPNRKGVIGSPTDGGNAVEEVPVLNLASTARDYFGGGSGSGKEDKVGVESIAEVPEEGTETGEKL